MSSKAVVLSLYKNLMRESQKFTNYNFRTYALRKIRDAFKEHKGLSEQKQVTNQINIAKENLRIIQRQAAIGDMYKTEKLVIENMH